MIYSIINMFKSLKSTKPDVIQPKFSNVIRDCPRLYIYLEDLFSQTIAFETFDKLRCQVVTCIISR